MEAKQPGRRRFLKQGAALAGFAAVGIQSAGAQSSAAEKPEAPTQDYRLYGRRSRFERSIRKLDLTGQDTPLQDSVGIITPSALHFVQSRGYDPPPLDPQQHRLLIHGLVDRPLLFSMQELKLFRSVSRILFLECPGNSARTAVLEEAKTAQQTHGKTSCSEWTGVPLSTLLREAGVQGGASWVVAEGAETGNRTQSVPMEKAMDDALVAYGQNGEALRPEQGYPIRLLLPGWAGGMNTKWLRRVKVVDQPYMSKWDFEHESVTVGPDGKAVLHPVTETYPRMPPRSVITFPSGGHHLPSPGFYDITGLAWSGGGAIRRVEVSTDGGKTWKDAELQEPVLPMAHTRFRFRWQWMGEEAVLESRCTDERGDRQPTLEELGKIRGFTRDNWQAALLSGRTPLPFNPVQAWKVTREGSVLNALF